MAQFSIGNSDNAIAKLLIALLGLTLATAEATIAQDYTISTIAGCCLPTTPTPALNVSVGTIQQGAISADSAGNVYFVSMNNVFKVDGSGNIVRIAGSSRETGYSGDGGPATSALLNIPSNPAGIAVDGQGNIYFTDGINSRVRRVSPDGIITTVAGNGTVSVSGDGGAATLAEIGFPFAVAVSNAGNLYIADYTENGRIRKVSQSGKISTLVNGVSVGGLAVDGGENVYYVPYGENRVARVSPGGTVTIMAGNGGYGYSQDGGLAVNTELGQITGLAVDLGGNLYIADAAFAQYGSQRIREVSLDGIITTVAGGGPNIQSDGMLATDANFQMSGVAVDASGDIYIPTLPPQVGIEKVDPSGIITTIAGNGTLSYSGDGGPAINAQFEFPTGVAVGRSGTVYIADAENYRIRQISPDGTISTIAGNGTIVLPIGLPVEGEPAVNASIVPNTVAADGVGNVYVETADRVFKISPDGSITTVAGGGTIHLVFEGLLATKAVLTNLPQSGIAADASGNLYIADSVDRVILKVSPDGIMHLVAGTPLSETAYPGDGSPALKASLNEPIGVAVDGAGNVYIADSSPLGGAIRKVTPGGIISTMISGDLNNPIGGTIAADCAGNLYIFNYYVYKVAPDGTLTTIAGSSLPGYTGDGGPATSARLGQPLENGVGIAVDNTGNVYVSDTPNNAIRLLKPDTPLGCLQPPLSLVSAGGDLQTGQPGAALPVPLSVVATDGNGNAIPGVSVAFTVSYGDGSVSPVTAITDSNGMASTNLTLGNAAALNVVDATAPQFTPAGFLEGGDSGGPPTVNITSVSGSGQSGMIGSPLPVPLSFIVTDANSNPVPGVPVVWQIVSGKGILSPAVGTTNSGGSVSANWTLGTLAGIQTITATVSGSSPVTFTATAMARTLTPNVPPNGVINNAGFDKSVAQGLAISPGMIAAIFGTNLSTVPVSGIQPGFMPGTSSLYTTFQGTTVTINGIPAPLYYVSPGQLDVQVPFELAESSADVVVTLYGLPSDPVSALVFPASPGILTVNSSGAGAAIVQNQDGTQNTAQNPAARGTVIQIYATGLGIVSPPGVTGQPAPSTPLSQCVIPPTVTIGGVPAVVSPTDSPFDFCGLAPSFVGLWQVNVQVPATISTGAVPLMLSISSANSNPVTVFVK